MSGRLISSKERQSVKTVVLCGNLNEGANTDILHHEHADLRNRRIEFRLAKVVIDLAKPAEMQLVLRYDTGTGHRGMCIFTFI